MKYIHLIAFTAIAGFFSCSGPGNSKDTAKDSTAIANIPSPFVKVNGTHFEVNGKPYYFLGANFWEGMNLASQGPGGDRLRLIRELDCMKSLGINNLRILA